MTYYVDQTAHTLILLGPAESGKRLCAEMLLKTYRNPWQWNFNLRGERYQHLPRQHVGPYRKFDRLGNDLIYNFPPQIIGKGKDRVEIFQYEKVGAAINAKHRGVTCSYMLFGAKHSEYGKLILKKDPDAFIIDLPHRPTEELFIREVEKALAMGKNIKGDVL